MLENHVVNEEVVVPSRQYFVMGDNRELSLDSRYWGFLPEENIKARPVFVYFSSDGETGDIRWARIFKGID
jgi:signal peptidase I